MADVEKADPQRGAGDEELEEEEETGGGQGLFMNKGLVIEDIPPEVARRIKALKKHQLEITKIESEFYKEMHALECKYAPLFKPYFDKRETIINGKYEPNDEECEFQLPNSEIDAELDNSLNKLTLGDEKKEKVPGIPQFWATVFQNVELLSEMAQDYDFPILHHLTDIQVEMSDEPMGFKLHFHFSPNEYFTNSILTKTYEMKCEMDPEDPFQFEGPEIVKCTGCTIDWVKGKNVTIKTIRKKQKHKQRGSIRTVSKTVEVPSFFNFFNPPQVPTEPDVEMDEETQMKLTNDFEVGQYIRERIVPRAVLYYTGEALEEEEDEDDFDEEEEEEEEAEDEEDDAPTTKKLTKSR